MFAACDGAHRQALGERQKLNPLCCVQASKAADWRGATGQGLGGLDNPRRLPLVSYWPALRCGLAFLPRAYLLHGPKLEGRLRPQGCPARQGGSSGKVAIGKACPLPRQIVAGGMGAAAPHGGAISASRPIISRGMIYALPSTPRRALPAAFVCLPECVTDQVLHVLDESQLKRWLEVMACATACAGGSRAPVSACQVVPPAGNTGGK